MNVSLDTGSNFDHTRIQFIDFVANLAWHPAGNIPQGKSHSDDTPANHKVWSKSVHVPEKHPKT